MEGVDYTQDQIRYLLKHVWFLDPEVGRDVKPLPAGWNWTIPTTGELTVNQANGYKRLSYDIAQLERYRHENERLTEQKNRVVFYGDSITDAWDRKGTEFFPGKNYVNRGISGQTTAQMLIRFRQDVIDLHPAVVVILAGTNDIAGNLGPSSLKMAADNIESMVQLARANGIRVVLCSLLPADHYNWRPDVKPAAYIREMNSWMKKYAADKGVVYVDYYSALANADGGMKEGTSKDGVHPTAEGYAIMAPLAEAGITAAMKKKP
ncbi:MAG: SGNH/GDSL hydrolase family protein [Acidobacteria bacterium]|nr:SGNH/GDSL hydrolase family protein [Acidobacteriota bacterium]